MRYSSKIYFPSIIADFPIKACSFLCHIKILVNESYLSHNIANMTITKRVPENHEPALSNMLYTCSWQRLYISFIIYQVWLSWKGQYWCHAVNHVCDLLHEVHFCSTQLCSHDRALLHTLLVLCEVIHYWSKGSRQHLQKSWCPMTNLTTGFMLISSGCKLSYSYIKPQNMWNYYKKTWIFTGLPLHKLRLNILRSPITSCPG